LRAIACRIPPLRDAGGLLLGVVSDVRDDDEEEEDEEEAAEREAGGPRLGSTP
jgi:hypothetical protein